MKTRQALINRMIKNNQAIERLEQENLKLKMQAIVMSDKSQWYKEEKETHGRGKNKREILVGRVYWKEKFIDEDTGEWIRITRSMVIKEDDVFVNLDFYNHTRKPLEKTS